MQWYEILTVIGGITVPIVVAILAERQSIKRLERRLGFGDDEASLKKQMDDKFGYSSKSIAEQIGVDANTPNLTLQHRNIHNAIVEQSNKISSITTLIAESTNSVQKRLDKLKGRQKDIKDKISDISDVIEDWQRLSEKCDEQAATINELNHTIAILSERLAEYENDEQPEQ